MSAAPGCCLVALVGGITLALLGQAQQAPDSGVVRGAWSLPEYDRQNPGKLKALPRGKGARQLPDGRVLLNELNLETYSLDGLTNLVVLGTNCVYDLRNRIASSPGLVRAVSGDHRWAVQGEGFTWWATNNNVVISNRVETQLRRGVGEAPPLPRQPDNPPLWLRADRVTFDYSSNLIEYTGAVRVEDPQLQVTCGTLTVHRSLSNSLDQIVCDRDVVIVNKLDRSRTTSDRAVYLLDETGETVHLSGRPHWEDGVREGTADAFILDRKRNVLHAIGRARLRLPVGAFGQVNFLGTRPIPSPAASPPTNRPIEVSAGLLSLVLPPTNGPIRGVLAQTNVLIVNLDEQSRARADRATYDEHGVLELTGKPVWTLGDRLVSGDLLYFDSSNRVFGARTNAFVRFPALALKEARPTGASTGGQTNATPATNQFIEVFSDYLVYQDEWLRFGESVRADYLEDTRKLGELHCAALAVKYTNRIETLVARGGVSLRQFPVARPDGKIRGRSLGCETLSLDWGPEGHISRITAEQRILFDQEETRTNQVAPSHKQFECDRLTACLSGPSNRVDFAVGEGNVRLRQGASAAQADHAVYTGTNGLLIVTGRPVATLPQGRISEASAFAWERTTGKLRVMGPSRSEWTQLPLGTNRVNLRPAGAGSGPPRP